MFFIFILWFHKVGEFFAFLAIFCKLRKITKPKKKKKKGHQKAFLNQNYVVLQMKIGTLSTYKYFLDGHIVTLTKLGIGYSLLYV